MAIKIAGTTVIDDNRQLSGGINLEPISASIADTAVDVFVYDTHKDSDGGAWRKRTQHTSWYNETLNTSTRGSRKEFPAVAVIVAESSQVTIYDGDDPDLPMWMVFNVGRTPVVTMLNWFTSGTASVSSVAQLNGRLCVGTDGGVTQFDFVEDAMYVSYTPSTAYTPINNRISSRNDSNASNSGSSSEYFYFIVNANINDVAMTVLPNAPIDPATQLPIPTIAVATNGGVSVIKDDGTVVDYTRTSGTQTIKSISFDSENRIWSGFETGGIPWVFFYDIPSSDTAVGTPQEAVYAGNIYPPLLPNFGTNYPLYGADVGNKAIRTNLGLIHVDHNAENRDNTMFAAVTSDYNTGWMNGDIKLATLSDTDDTNVTGSELVTNGTFDTDITGWSGYSGTSSDSGRITHDTGGDGGRIKLTNDTSGTANARASQGFSTVVGKRYIATADLVAGTSTAMYLIKSNNANLSSGTVTSTSSDETLVLEFEATVTTTYIGVANVNATSGHTMFADNITCRLAEEDRSVNGNGLQVFGTVTKNPVATGADLVAYSGWSSSNYLHQPYNSDLDFGTGDFCVMGWFKSNNAPSAQEHLIARGDISNGYWRILVDATPRVYFQISISAVAVNSIAYDTTIGTEWQQFCGVRIGNTIYLYINGKLVGTDTHTSTANVSFTGDPLEIGNCPTVLGSNNPVDGSLALWRTSATAPSPEQIKRIYEDEKVLFQENAQATLYGSSDAVTALAYDDSTNLLHVGTSAGRSVFQGLRRVDNTTTAVGAAISASNGLVADE